VRPFLLPRGKNKAIPTDETKQRREELAATRVNLMPMLIDIDLAAMGVDLVLGGCLR
jgi:hypothetical protein